VERDTKGRFTRGNTAALVHGARSKQASALQAPLREAIISQVITDLGGDTSVLPTTILRLVDRFAETSLLCDAYMLFLQEQGGPIGTRGRQRAAVSGYLACLDRQMKLAQLIGLERRTKDISTMSIQQYLEHERQRQQPGEGESMPTMRLDHLRAVRDAAGVGISQLASASLTSDLLINTLEQRPVGGACQEAEAQRIAAALGVTLDTLGAAVLTP
jgi:hypothetical protein